jgi:hypothetical protein
LLGSSLPNPAYYATTVVEQGAIRQEFLADDNGTLTVQFFIDGSVASDYQDGLEAVQFTFNYESEQAGILSIASIDYPSDPLLKVSDSEDYGQVNFAMLFDSLNDSIMGNLYDVYSDVAFAEVTFNANLDSVYTFTVSGVGLSEAGGTSNYPEGRAVSILNF